MRNGRKGVNDRLTKQVKKALQTVINPASGRTITDEGRVAGISCDDAGIARFSLEIENSAREDGEKLLKLAEDAVRRVDGVRDVKPVLTAHSPQTSPARGGGHANPLGVSKRPRIEAAADNLKDVKAIVAIASGKGGVGKSTIAANIAVALSSLGYRTGLLDADIYGPSLPTLYGVHEKAAMHEGRILPFERFGVRAMSIGFLVDPEQALAWRGPMVMGALRQMLNDVDWGPLDIMLVDTPPGTGDAHLSLIQTKKLTGAVIVSTPQELALADVRRGVALFRKTNTPVLGVIENMAYLEDSNGKRTHLFGDGGARRAAEALKAPFLGEVPIIPDLREACDSGAPIAAQDHPARSSFIEFARKIAAAVALN